MTKKRNAKGQFAKKSIKAKTAPKKKTASAKLALDKHYEAAQKFSSSVTAACKAYIESVTA